jgi:hypothetical protein
LVAVAWQVLLGCLVGGKLPSLGKGKEMELTKKEQAVRDRAIARNNLVAFIDKGGLFVFTIKSTSASNMSFSYDLRLYFVNKEGQIDDYFVNWSYAQMLGMKLNKRGEVKGSGCGIDRAFECINNLEAWYERETGVKVSIPFRAVY